MTVNTALMNDQLALEEEMRSMGIARFRESVEKAKANHSESRTSTVRKLVAHTHMDVVAGITTFIEAASSGRAGPKHSALKYIMALDDVDMVAHLTVRSIMDSISSRETLQRAALDLATLIEDELHFRSFKEQAPGLYKGMHKKVASSPTARHRRNAMLIPARKAGVKLDEWGTREKVLVGSKLIEIFVEVTGLATITRSSEGANNTPIYLEATLATLEWIENENNRNEWMAPIYLPTVHTPKPWTTPFDGGYWSGRVRSLTLVKTRSKAYLAELAERDMPEVYAAVNALQDTPWAINHRVLEVMEHMWEHASGHGLIPSPDPQTLPTRPLWLTEDMTKEDMTSEQLALFGSWKRSCSITHGQNAKAVSTRLSFMRMLMVARKMSAYDTFHFPHQLDWRGRVYPVALYLHPQGNDAQRGLLEFSSSVPLTDEDGVQWLAVHGAGLWGVDKVDFEDRRAWIEQHSDQILAAANDPLVGTFWMEAEKPWEALAFCFEWAGWKSEGYAYESSLPIQMDGTCNGLQNFSAILRDPIGGAAVNLTPSPKPQDIYATVADVVAKLVEADLTNETRIKKTKTVTGADGKERKEEVEGPMIRELAAGWFGKVTRKVTKRPVMTLAYGAREFGFKTQVFEDTVNPWKQDGEIAFPWADNLAWDAAAYMGGLIWDAVQTVVVAATEAMNWLQEAARVAAKEGLPVLWTTPTGFLVRQAYTLPNVKRIDTTFEQVRIRLSIDQGNNKLDTRKQASGISPNWVHSLDASHMQLTIARLQSDGMRSFCMIHDSYGTHAGNAQVMANALREEFVAMYQPNVLALFRDDLLAQLPAGSALPDLPTMGTLDLNLVLESQFFFA
jgi:DNA-directed RNA polymerase